MKSREKIEFGDFQTPAALAKDVCDLLQRLGISVASIVEPNCGQGNLLVAASDAFPMASGSLGVDINESYIEQLRRRIKQRSDAEKIAVAVGNFFSIDWNKIAANLSEPILVVGNPPWVTSAGLGALDSGNLPKKENRENLAGMDALTGKSNFDISEWMIHEQFDWFRGKRGTLAMLCKTAVARKVLLRAWREDRAIASAALYGIDAKRHFNAAVDACLLVCQFSPERQSHTADVFDDLDASLPTRQIGFRDGLLVADVPQYEQWKHLVATTKNERSDWRSGIKHDCASVMELRPAGDQFVNKLGETVAIESDFVYPMFKGSDVAGECEVPRNWMIVPQTSVGEDTQILRTEAPRTWDYLSAHAEAFQRRRSSIYRNRPRFSIFGVGPYTFAPWKVAVAGLYKSLRFRVVGSFGKKPIVLDDTANFLPCQSRDEAEFMSRMLNSEPARQFFSAFVCWDAKRPVTVELLKKIDLGKLASHIGEADAFAALFDRHDPQQRLFAT